MVQYFISFRYEDIKDCFIFREFPDLVDKDKLIEKVHVYLSCILDEVDDSKIEVICASKWD